MRKDHRVGGGAKPEALWWQPKNVDVGEGWHEQCGHGKGHRRTVRREVETQLWSCRGAPTRWGWVGGGSKAALETRGPGYTVLRTAVRAPEGERRCQSGRHRGEWPGTGSGEAVIQPFSQKSRTPTVTTECQIGLYDPAEADLELFCNSWSAGFLGERL